MKNELKQMYANGNHNIEPSISIDGLLKAVTMKLITTDDVIEIVGDKNVLSIIREAKLREISNACNKTILNGIELKLGGDFIHFNLSIEDQSNITNLFHIVELGGTEFPFQSDNGVCRIFTATEIAQIYVAAQNMIMSQIIYHNGLKSYVQNLNTIEEISMVNYGMELPEPYLTEVNEKLTIAQNQLNAIISKVIL